MEARPRLLRVVRRGLYTRQSQRATPASKAMRKAHSAGPCPQPASAAALSDAWAPRHRVWTEAWSRLARSPSHDAQESLTELRCSAVAAAGRPPTPLASLRAERSVDSTAGTAQPPAALRRHGHTASGGLPPASPAAFLGRLWALDQTADFAAVSALHPAAWPGALVTVRNPHARETLTSPLSPPSTPPHGTRS